MARTGDPTTRSPEEPPEEPGAESRDLPASEAADEAAEATSWGAPGRT
jgi:hypothetical protein